MSTVVDNNKYIINGSTLSAIGDALREIGIPPKELQVETNIYYKNYTSPYVNGSSYTATLSASEFGLVSQTPIKVKITVTAVNSNYGGRIMIKGADESTYTQVTVNSTYSRTLPVTLKCDLTNYSAQMVAKIYPLDNNGNYIIPTSEDDTSGYSTKVATTMVPNPNRQILVQDIPTLISIPIDYQGLSYGYISTGSTPGFWQDSSNNNWVTYIPLTSGQRIGFCIGKTVSNRLRAAFFQEKVYSDFQQYITQPASSQIQIYTGNVNITGTTELTGDGLLKRFYYTAPSDGELIITTSNARVSAPLHIWRA